QKDLAQPIGMGEERREFVRDCQAEHDLFFRRDWLDGVHGPLDHVAEIRGAWLDREGRRRQAYGIQQILDQLELRRRVLFNDLQAAVHGARVWSPQDRTPPED